MTSVSLDVSELRSFAADLTSASLKAVLAVRPAVSKGALNIKTQMRAEMGESAHFRQVVPAIDYDLLDGGLTAEIGPDTTGETVGDLAHIAYFGGSPGGGGTVPDPIRALEAEAPKFEKALDDILKGLL